MAKSAGIVGFALLLVAILWQAGQAPMTAVPQLLAAVTIALLFVHATVAVGFLTALGFAGIVLVCAFAIENLGAATGFPFGHYHFVVGSGLPHIGRVPLIVGPLYFGVGYGAYVIASAITHDRIATVPLAALTITMWDMSMDPVNSTVNGLWLWHSGGIYYGVPLSNFLGWFFEMLIAFAAARAFLRARDVQFDFSRRAFWMVPLLLYLAAGLSQVTPWLSSADAQIRDAGGRVWSVLAIYRASVLVAVLGMLPLAALATTQIWKPRAF